MEYIAVVLCAITAALSAACLIMLVSAKKSGSARELKELSHEFERQQQLLRKEITESVQSSMRMLGGMVSQNQKTADELLSGRFSEMDKSISGKQENLNRNVTAMMVQLENRFKSFEAANEQKLENMRETVEKRLAYLQQDNNEKLESMRMTVDEKLQKTLEERMTQSFKLVNERLEQVYKGLGEMQNLAVGVGDLKKVLSNVKTRGILGEIQLEAILKEILSPEQYETNVATVPGRAERVEFAVKLPGDDGNHVYLPIDSKFPADAYAELQTAYESGSAETVSQSFAVLSARIRAFAKDIRTKYVFPPYTTDFAVMFLPFEGLYAEVVNRGLVDVLQREYRVSIAGPSTMAALLNSLQMGFRTLAIQKRSGEVWQILGAVKTEFDKFGDTLAAAQQKLTLAGNELDKLVGTRTRAIQRKLRDVEKLEQSELLDE